MDDESSAYRRKDRPPHQHVLRKPLLLWLAGVAALLGSGCGGGTTSGIPGASPITSNSSASGSSASGTTAAPGASGPAATSSPTPLPGATRTPAPSASPSPAPSPSAIPSGAAVAGGFASLDRPGPPLSVPAAELAASITCSPIVGTSPLHTILLIPGTTLTPAVNYDWNYERAFTANDMPWCAVTLPDNAMADIPTAGEYIVNAIRTVSQRTARTVDILGYSQGGMVPRWALRFWPDTRALVDSFVALDPSNHGTADTDAVCAVSCAVAFWQQGDTSHFITALNSGAETFAGIAYTVIYSDTDEVVVPNLPIASSSSLSTGTGTIANISVQSICPTDVSEHLAMGSYDPVGYALAIDAFAHNTIASPADVPASTCLELYQPGVDPTTFAQNYAMYGAYVATVIATTPMVTAEPSLPPYVYSGS